MRTIKRIFVACGIIQFETLKSKVYAVIVLFLKT